MLRRFVHRTLDRIFWPLKPHYQKVSIGAVASAASVSSACAAYLTAPYDRYVPVGLGATVIGLFYLATQSWERHREAQEDRQDAVVKQAVKEWTDKYTGPQRAIRDNNTGSKPAIREPKYLRDEPGPRKD